MNKSKKGGKSKAGRAQRPSQSQRKQPGREHLMSPLPEPVNPAIRGSHKLGGKVALITGGDSGIGRACATAFAREGADVAIVYLEENQDAAMTRDLVESYGRSCLVLKGDLRKEKFCGTAVDRTLQTFGRLNILINNAAEQHPQKSLEDITLAQLQKTFESNIFSMFMLSKAALPHLKKQPGSSIINTTSVTAYRGSPELLDYSATKGAIVSFTRSLSQNLAESGIRVNAVAPGPIWTPLIPSTFKPKKVQAFGSDSPLGRATLGMRGVLCLSRFGSRFVHDRPGAASKWGRNYQRLGRAAEAGSNHGRWAGLISLRFSQPRLNWFVAAIKSK